MALGKWALKKHISTTVKAHLHFAIQSWAQMRIEEYYAWGSLTSFRYRVQVYVHRTEYVMCVFLILDVWHENSFMDFLPICIQHCLERKVFQGVSHINLAWIVNFLLHMQLKATPSEKDSEKWNGAGIRIEEEEEEGKMGRNRIRKWLSAMKHELCFFFFCFLNGLDLSGFSVWDEKKPWNLY